MMHRLTSAIALLFLSGLAFAGPAMDAAGAKQATNWHAIIMFLIFVAMTMGITYWAVSYTHLDVYKRQPLNSAMF